MRLVHLLYLILELVLKRLYINIMILFELILSTCASFLQLLESDLELSLGLNQVFLVVLFLVL